MVRQGLVVLLENFNDFEVVAETHNGHMALTLCHKYQPHVVLMDLLMPEVSGIEAIQLIHRQYPETQIVALSGALDETLLYESLKAGAISYLLKTGSIDEVAEAVRRAYRGQPMIPNEVLHTLISIQQRPSKIEYQLTLRQRQILSLMIEGLSNRQIARRLSVNIGTVGDHMSRIFDKLDVHNRTKAIAIAIQHRLLK